MSEAKPFASLSSGLLARKGSAKPAMRRPYISFNQDNVQEKEQDDLGWNDMGYDVDPDISTEVPAEKPINPLERAIVVPIPEVKQQQERIAAQLQITNDVDAIEPVEEDVKTKVDQDSVRPVASISQIVENNVEVQDAHTDAQNEALVNAPVKPLVKPAAKKRKVAKKAGTTKTKAAFTLRLDPERHLKLRLACAINNISAQKFVTEALDNKLSGMDQIDHLSGQITEK